MGHVLILSLFKINQACFALSRARIRSVSVGCEKLMVAYKGSGFMLPEFYTKSLISALFIKSRNPCDLAN